MAEVDSPYTCCICDEMYDELIRKPLALPCGHTFCKSCIEQMQANAKKLCPVCRNNWTEHLSNSLMFIRQLVPPKDDTNKISSETSEIKSSSKNVHFDQVFWCQSCQISVCKHGLRNCHQKCDWILVEEKIDELKNVLQTSTQPKRKYLADLFSQGTANNITNLSNVRALIKQLQEYEQYFMSLETSIKIETESAMNCLEELENQPPHASVVDYLAAITKAETLHDDPVPYPNVTDFYFLFNSKEEAVPEIDVTKSSEDTTNDVSGKTFEVLFSIFQL